MTKRNAPGVKDPRIPLDPEGLAELAAQTGKHRRARAIMGAFVASDAVALAGRMAEFDGFHVVGAPEPEDRRYYPVPPTGNRKARRAARK